MLYNNIVEAAADGSAVPELAETIETDDAKTWRLQVEGAEWHNGKSLDVNDMMAS